jgi:hypothetical protein
VCRKLEAEGFWADFTDPSIGYAVRISSYYRKGECVLNSLHIYSNTNNWIHIKQVRHRGSAVYNDIEGVQRLLSYPVVPVFPKSSEDQTQCGPWLFDICKRERTRAHRDRWDRVKW